MPTKKSSTVASTFHAECDYGFYSNNRDMYSLYISACLVDDGSYLISKGTVNTQVTVTNKTTGEVLFNKSSGNKSVSNGSGLTVFPTSYADVTSNQMEIPMTEAEQTIEVKVISKTTSSWTRMNYSSGSTSSQSAATATLTFELTVAKKAPPRVVIKGFQRQSDVSKVDITARVYGFEGDTISLSANIPSVDTTKRQENVVLGTGTCNQIETVLSGGGSIGSFDGGAITAGPSFGLIQTLYYCEITKTVEYCSIGAISAYAIATGRTGDSERVNFTVPSSFFTMDIGNKGKEIAFGGVAIDDLTEDESKSGLFKCGMISKFDNALNCLGNAEFSGDANFTGNVSLPLSATVNGLTLRPHVGEHLFIYGTESAGANVTLTGSWKNLIRDGFNVVSNVRNYWAEWDTTGEDLPLIKLNEACHVLIFWKAYAYNGFTANDSIIIGANVDYKNQDDPGNSNVRTARYRTPIATPYTTISGMTIRSCAAGQTIRLMGYNATGSRGTISDSGHTSFGIVRID